MNCPTTTPTSTSQVDLLRRINRLERSLAGFKEITGVDPSTGPSVVTVLSVDHAEDTGFWTIVWVSTPGETYQVQTSTDALTWVVLDNSVAAAADATSTTWVSEFYAMDSVDYFRIRRYPRTLAICTP